MVGAVTSFFPIISTGYNLHSKEPSPSTKKIGPFTISISPRLSSNHFTEAQTLVPKIVWCFMGWNLHQLLSLKLIQTLKRGHPKRKAVFQLSICRDYVSSGRALFKMVDILFRSLLSQRKCYSSLLILLIIQNSGVHHLEGCWIPSPDGSIRPPRARGARAPPLLCHVWVGHHPAIVQHRSTMGMKLQSSNHV